MSFARLGRHGEGHLQGRLQGGGPRAELCHQREVHRGRGLGGGGGHLEHGPGAVVRLAGLQGILRRGAPRGSEPIRAAGVGPDDARRAGARCREGGSIGNGDQGQSQNGLEPARHRRLFLRRRRQASRRGKEDQLRGRLGLVRLRSDRRHSLGPLQRPAGAEGQVRARHDHQSLTARARMPPIAQYVFNGVVTGGILALPAVAFSLLWRLLRFPNFAVSTYLTVGAYVALVLNHGVPASLELAWLGALVVTGALALVVDRIAFRPMRDRRPFSLAIASIGVAFVLENVVRFVWGNDFRSYDVPVTRGMSVAGLRIGRDQLLVLGVAVVLMARSEEHTSELQSLAYLVCRLLLEKKKKS